MTLEIIVPVLYLISSAELLPIYVANSSDVIVESTCSVEGKLLYPCVTPEILDISGFTRNDSVSILFIHQNYTIDANISLGLKSLTSVTLQPWKIGLMVSILCIGDFSIDVSEIEFLLIQSIQFINCGKYNHLLEFKNCSRKVDVNISQTMFIGTVKCSILLQCGTVVNFYIGNCFLEGGGMNSLNHSIHIQSSNIIECEFSNTRFINNSAGAVYFNTNGSLQIQSCFFAYNKNPRKKGSAISIVDSRNVIINNTTFYRNFNTSIVYAQGKWPMILSISNSNFNENTGHNGGVLRIAHSSKMQFCNTNFTRNEATERGGVISGNPATNGIEWNISIIKCIFKANFAVNGFGGVFSMQAFSKVLLAMNETIFIYNFAQLDGGVFHVSDTDRFVLKMNNIQIIGNTADDNGGVIYASSIKTFELWGANFCNNSAQNGGAIYTISIISIKIEGGLFYNNVASFDGGAIVALETKTFSLKQTIYYANSAPYSGGSIHFTKFENIHIILCSFNYSSASHSGGAIYLRNDDITVKSKTLDLFQSNFFGNQAKQGGSIYLENAYMNIIECNISSSTAWSAGGAVYAQAAKLDVNGFVSYNNSARLRGGSIALLNSNVYFKYNSKFILDEVISSVGFGGAIYIQDKDEDCYIGCLLDWEKNSNIAFMNTSAHTGPMIFGGMLDRCDHLFGNRLMNVINFNDKKYNINSHGITSLPSQVCQCKNKINQCWSGSDNRNVFPGKKFNIEVMCIDQLKQNIPCDIRSEYQQKEVMLGQGQNFKKIQKCQNLSFTAFSENINASILLLMGGLCSNNKENALMFKLRILPCPEGFENIDRKCQCDRRLKELFQEVQCNIENGSIVITEGWLGYDGEHIRACKICPLSYCNLNESSTGIFLSNSDQQCNHNRSRILCGQCISNYSVILGSWKCKDCSNSSRYNFVWLLIVVALAGVALIVFLLLTKMTVSSGTTNGLILYANIISFSGLLDQYSSSTHPIFRVILSWINLDLGINVCFYSGMDVYQKIWLQFAFPFYLWFLVGLIIIFCHYSSRIMKLMGMRNIEILATLFLLSYTKLLKNITTVLSVVTINVADSRNASNSFSSRKVWVYDGNIEYLGQKHLPLFAVAMFFLLFLFLPYTILLISGQCFRSLPRRKGLQWIHSTVLTSVLDAYHAPYGGNHRYWTGLGLMFRCCLFTIFSTSYSIQKNLLWTNIGLIIFLCYRQVFCSKIYHKKFSDLLELFYLMNLALLSVTLLYTNSKYPFIVSVTSALAAFFATFIYHVFVVARSLFDFPKLLECIKKVKKNPRIPEKEGIVDSRPTNTSTFVELRESLLDN